MAQEFEHILEDNIYLKKNLQIARHQLDKLQQQLSDERMLNQEIIDKNTSINEDYNHLQKRHQMQVAEHSKDISILTSQVEELKELIERKQQELEQFQLKIIPNIDQDMIRVKLITEMEGPYQEVVQKKDKEIMKLKEKLSEAQRRSSLLQLQLQTKDKDHKREIQDSKRYYQAQNQKLTKELNLALTRKEAKSYDKQLFKNQRKQLEELRYTIHLQSQNETELRKQVSSLKIEKEKLLIQISQLNQKKALQIHLSAENEEIRLLKHDKHKMQDQIVRKNEELQKMEKKHKVALTDAKANEEQLRRKMIESRQVWEQEKESFRDELSKQKSDLNRAKDKADRFQEDIDILIQRYKNLERQLNSKKQENSKLKQNIDELQINIKQLQLAKRQKLSLSKHFESGDLKPTKKDDSFDEAKKENDEKKTNLIINKKHENTQKTIQLEKMNAKLKEKLELANEKIVGLLKEKAANAKGNTKPIPTSNSRDRAFSNVEPESMRQRTDKAFLLEYRDASFTPLVPPTIFTQPN